MSLMDLTAIPYVPAKWFTHIDPNTPRKINKIVLHVMEAPDKPNTAMSVAEYFKSGSEGRQASAHLNIDSTHVIKCVNLSDVAYGAPGANHDGIHIEHAGFSEETGKDWSNDYNKAMLELSAQVAAAVCARYTIPPVFLSPADLEAGKRGITTHQNCTLAYGGTHHDPGPGFPIQSYVARVAAILKAEGVKL